MSEEIIRRCDYIYTEDDGFVAGLVCDLSPAQRTHDENGNETDRCRLHWPRTYRVTVDDTGRYVELEWASPDLMIVDGGAELTRRQLEVASTRLSKAIAVAGPIGPLELVVTLQWHGEESYHQVDPDALLAFLDHDWSEGPFEW